MIGTLDFTHMNLKELSAGLQSVQSLHTPDHVRRVPIIYQYCECRTIQIQQKVKLQTWDAHFLRSP